jgi:hypothetical protein
MRKARTSGIHVQPNDVPLILGMVGRGDRRHDIAAWFGLNQGRIKEVEDGDHGSPSIAKSTDLFPAGSPGLKARSARESIVQALQSLTNSSDPNVQNTTQVLQKAINDFDKDE